MLHWLKQRLYHLLALGGIKVPAGLLLRLANANQTPALAPVPSARRVLVLAPHMDDETIGCGGAICQHVRAGSRVEVLFLTDGAKGFEAEDLRSLSHAARCERRRAESEDAARVLGVSATHYLDLPDGSSQVDDHSLAAMLAVLESVSPDLVYLPFLTDSHHDHRTTVALFLAACRSRPTFDSLLCNCYEVWAPLLPNHIVDITDDIEQKMAALQCYASQLAMNDYLSSVRGLNAYRAIANRSQGYAEAFFLTTASEYRALAEGSA